MTPDPKLVELMAQAYGAAHLRSRQGAGTAIGPAERIDAHMAGLRAALAAISASGEWWIAPAEPSETMLNAMNKAQPLDGGRYDNAREWDRVYQLPRWRAARDAHLKDTGK